MDQLTNPDLQESLQCSGITEPLSEFARQKGLSVLHGRALYPRFYTSRQGLEGDAWSAYVPRDYPGLGFYLIGPNSQNVILPLDASPEVFQHATDVIAIGCQRDEYLEAQLLILVGESTTILQRDPQPDWSCRLTH